MRCRRRFWALHKGDVDGRVGRSRGAAVKDRRVMARVAVLLVQALHAGGVRRQQELLQGVGQRRARLDLAGLLGPGGLDLVLARG